MGEVMGEDTDQDNKQQNPDEESAIDENQSEEESQVPAPEEAEENTPEPKESVESEDAIEESDGAEEKSSDESEQDKSSDEPADESVDTGEQGENESPSEEPEVDSETNETPTEKEPQEGETKTETDESGIEDEALTSLEPEQIIEPEAELHEESDKTSDETETSISTEEAEDELLAGMPPETIVEKEETETDVAAMEAEGSHAEHTISTDSNSHHAPVVVIVALLVGLLMVAVAFMAYQSTQDNSVVEDTTSQTEDQEVSETPERVAVYEAQAKLTDVTTASLASGDAGAKYYDDGAYELVASFINLPDVTNGEFFEGWLVNPETTKFVSTGVVEYVSEGQVVNNFSATQDYQTQGYTFYVLTLEPDDDDPAPADHVLEGTLETVN